MRPPLAFLDLETTGLRADARIIEVAVVHLDPGEPMPRVVFRARVNPEIEIPTKASSITGITDADVADCPTWAAVAPEVMAVLFGRVVAAYNAPADFKWLLANNARVGAELPTWPWIDLLVPVKFVDKYERDKTLAGVAARRGIAVAAHGAAGDAVATALLFPDLIGEIRDLPLFWRLQRGMALQAEEEFCAFLRRQGPRGARPECAWHELEEAEPPPWPEPPTPSAACPFCSGRMVYRITQAGVVQLEGFDGGLHVCRPGESDDDGERDFDDDDFRDDHP